MIRVLVKKAKVFTEKPIQGFVYQDNSGCNGLACLKECVLQEFKDGRWVDVKVVHEEELTK